MANSLSKPLQEDDEDIYRTPETQRDLLPINKEFDLPKKNPLTLQPSASVQPKMGNLLGASFGKNKASEDIKEEKPKEEQKFSLFSALGGQKLEDKEQKEVVPTTREKLHFLDMKKAFLGMEAPPKVDKGIVRLKCHGKNLIFRHYGNGISYQNPIRYFCIKVISWKWFENFILLCIAMNSFALAFYDYSMQDKDNNYRIDMVSAIVTVIFLFEAAMKIIAMGFGFYRYTYIADPWNILDFLICVTGVSDFMGQEIADLKPIRTLRVLRPLRSFSQIKGIRIQVETLILSLPKLAQVSVFLGFMFVLFGIFGLQLFQGVVFAKCRLNEKPLNATYWPFEQAQVCDINSSGKIKCPKDQFCGAPWEYDISLKDDYVYNNASIQFGISSFFNFFDSVLAVFQIITNDSWTTVLFNLQDSYNQYIATIYCCSVVLICSFFMLNLLLAVVMDSFQNQVSPEETRRQIDEVQNDPEQRIKSIFGTNLNIQKAAENSEDDRVKLLAKQTDKMMDQDKEDFKPEMIAEIYFRKQTEISKQDTIVSRKSHIEVQELDDTFDRADQVLAEIPNDEKVHKRTESHFNLQALESKKKEEEKQRRAEQLEASPGDLNLPTQGQLSTFRSPKEEIGKVKFQTDNSQGSFRSHYSAEMDATNHLNIGQSKTPLVLGGFGNQARPSALAGIMGVMGSGEESKEKKPIGNGLLEAMTVRFNDIEQIQNPKTKKKAVKDYTKKSNWLLKQLETGLKKELQKKKKTYGIENEESVQAKLQDQVKSLALGFKASANLPPNQQQAAKSALKLKGAFAIRNELLKEAMKKSYLTKKTSKTQAPNAMNLFSSNTFQSQNTGTQAQAGSFLAKSMGKYFKDQMSTKLKVRLVKVQAEKAIEKQQNLIQDERAYKYKLGWLLALIRSDIFMYFITACIVANTVILATESYPQDKGVSDAQEISNIVFYVVFLLEMVMKLAALGFKEYFSDRFNSFDAFIIFVSSIDVIISATSKGSQDSAASSAITAMRIFRLLRVFKLIKAWKKLNQLVMTMGKTVLNIGYFVLLLSIFIVIYTLLGMNLFAYQVAFNSEDKLDLVNGNYPDSTFNNFLQGFFSVFIVLGNDGWSTIYFNHYRANKPISSSFFFISLLIVGQYILLNLFLAILLNDFEMDSIENMELSNDEKKQEKLELQRLGVKQKIKNKIARRILKGISGRLKAIFSGKRFDGEGNLISEYNNDKSLSFFSLDSCLRQVCRKIIIPNDDSYLEAYLLSRKMTKMQEEGKPEEQIRRIQTDIIELNNIANQEKDEDEIQEEEERKESTSFFEYFILFFILVSCIHLTLENPLANPEGQLAKVLRVVDFVTTGVFTFEFLVKVIAFGFIVNGKKSYIRQAWNQLDFIILVVSYISIGSNVNISTLKILRMLRVMRPLRILSRNQGLKVSIGALISAIPDILNILMISVLFFIVYGILAIGQFKGTFYSCNEYIEVVGSELQTKWDCINQGGVWKNFWVDFDNVFDAVLLLYAMADGVGWAEVMYKGISARGIDKEPQSQYSPFMGLFFVIFMIWGYFFILNLFVGAVISTYNRQKETLGKVFLLSGKQKKWLQTKFLLLQAQPKLDIPVPQQKFKQRLYAFLRHQYFEYFILTCIFINTIFLALIWYNQDNKWTEVLGIVNYVFLGIFTVEAILKLYSFGIRFFRDNWNIFDLLIVIGAFIGLIINRYTTVDSVGPATTVIRSFRICRIFKLMRKWKGLAIIFQTFLITLPALINVGALLILFVYIYAILGVNLFAIVKHIHHVNDHVNFMNVGTAMLTLLRISTGENWHMVLSSLQQERQILYQCINNPDYEDYKENDYEPIGCGIPLLSTFFFSTFVLVVSLVFLNLFIAIILQGFADSSDEEQFVFSADTTLQFQDTWSKFDPDATGFINIEDLEDFLTKLGKPLGFSEAEMNNPYKAQAFIETLEEELEKYEDETKYLFMDVLEILSLNHMLSIEAEKEEDGAKNKEDLKKSILIGQQQNSMISKDVQLLEEKAKKKVENKKNKKLNKQKKENYKKVRAKSVVEGNGAEQISKLTKSKTGAIKSTFQTIEDEMMQQDGEGSGQEQRSFQYIDNEEQEDSQEENAGESNSLHFQILDEKVDIKEPERLIEETETTPVGDRRRVRANMSSSLRKAKRDVLGSNMSSRLSHTNKSIVHGLANSRFSSKVAPQVDGERVETCARIDTSANIE